MKTWIQVVMAVVAVASIVLSQTLVAGTAAEEILLGFGAVVLAGLGVGKGVRAVKGPPTLLALIVAISAVTGTACKLTDGVDWPDVANCGVPIASDLIGTISRIYLNGKSGWRDELTDLARIHGTETVACLSDVFIRRHTAPGAAQTPEIQAAVGRATVFLGERSIEVRRDAR